MVAFSVIITIVVVLITDHFLQHHSRRVAGLKALPKLPRVSV